MSDCTKCKHKNDRNCYCPPDKWCVSFKEEVSRVKYVFEFDATDDWVPGESACWTDCPFSILLDLGSRCKCVVGKAVCPFLNEKYLFMFKEQQRGA